MVRALARTLALPLFPGTYDYGSAFEHFIILECYKLIQYFYPDYRLFYLNSHEGLEVDLVVERPGLPLLMIEIKSTREVLAIFIKNPLFRLFSEEDFLDITSIID